MNDQLCLRCKVRRRRQHFNAKWCLRCSKDLRKKPKSPLSRDQIKEARGLIGKMPREEIAERIGCSVSSLKRAFRGTRLAFHNKWVRQPDLVKRVCEFYSKNGRSKTEKQFPGICVRSIIERYPLPKKRQIRWTEDQIVELARMGGLITMRSQAKFFRRPRAHAGSIKSVWVKKFRNCCGGIHGMSEHMARHLVRKNCPFVETGFWIQRRRGVKFGRKLYLWVDMERHLQPGVPEFIRSAVITLADFQRWLFRSKNPRPIIIRLVQVREVRA